MKSGFEGALPRRKPRTRLGSMLADLPVKSDPEDQSPDTQKDPENESAENKSTDTSPKRSGSKKRAKNRRDTQFQKETETTSPEAAPQTLNAEAADPSPTERNSKEVSVAPTLENLATISEPINANKSHPTNTPIPEASSVSPEPSVSNTVSETMESTSPTIFESSPPHILEVTEVTSRTISDSEEPIASGKISEATEITSPTILKPSHQKEPITNSQDPLAGVITHDSETRSELVHPSLEDSQPEQINSTTPESTTLGTQDNKDSSIVSPKPNENEVNEVMPLPADAQPSKGHGSEPSVPHKHTYPSATNNETQSDTKLRPNSSQTITTTRVIDPPAPSEPPAATESSEMVPNDEKYVASLRAAVRARTRTQEAETSTIAREYESRPRSNPPGDEVVKAGRERIDALRERLAEAARRTQDPAPEPLTTASRIRATVESLRRELTTSHSLRKSLQAKVDAQANQLISIKNDLEKERRSRQSAEDLAAERERVTTELLDESEALAEERDLALSRIAELRALESSREEVLAELETALHEKDSALDTARARIQELQDAMEATTTEMSVLESKLAEARDTAQAAATKIESLEEEVREARATRDALLEIERLVET